MKRRFVWQRASRGQSVVEFALVSLTLLMLMFGIIDLGRGVYSRAMLANAAREGARTGMVAKRNEVTVPDGVTSCAASTYCGSIVTSARSKAPSLNITASQ